MKKNISKILLALVLIVILGGIAWRYSSTNTVVKTEDNKNNPTKDVVSIPTSKIVVVSNKLSEYRNEELGFSVKYPTVWEKTESPTSIGLIIPIDSTKGVNTVNDLQAKIDVISGKCSFPPVTTIKERSTLKVGDYSLNMISIANTVQARSFFNRMYSLQKDSICYFFSYSSITTSPKSKGLSASDIQKASANNTAMVDAADIAFKDMVKSFQIVQGAAGKDESTVAPKK